MPTPLVYYFSLTHLVVPVAPGLALSGGKARWCGLVGVDLITAMACEAVAARPCRKAFRLFVHGILTPPRGVKVRRFTVGTFPALTPAARTMRVGRVCHATALGVRVAASRALIDGQALHRIGVDVVAAVAVETERRENTFNQYGLEIMLGCVV